MTLSHYKTTLGSQSIQRKRFHEQRMQKRTDADLTVKTVDLSITSAQKKRNVNKITFASHNTKLGHSSLNRSRLKPDQSFNKSVYNDSIYISNTQSDWKEEVITGKFKNPKKINSKYSAALRGAYQSSNNWNRTKNGDQNSFYGDHNRSMIERPNTSNDIYGGGGGSRENISFHNQSLPNLQNEHANQSRSSGGSKIDNQRDNKFGKRSQSIRTRGSNAAKKDYSYDMVRNYKSRAFKESQPVYGAIDAFNRQILRNTHEGKSGAKSANKIAFRPVSKLSQHNDSGTM